jgi:hypothetical protein
VASYWAPLPDANTLGIAQGAMLSGTLSPILETSVKSQEPAAIKTSLPIYQTAWYYIPQENKLHIYSLICKFGSGATPMILKAH